MHTKTMEGLVGARTNMNLVNVPMRVFRDARRRGDMAVMERALGYAGEFADRAVEYKTKAEEGMKEDAQEAREKEKLAREEAIAKRREEREKLEKRIEEIREGKADKPETGTDKVELSEAGKALTAAWTKQDNMGAAEVKMDMEKELSVYTRTGEVKQTRDNETISVTV